jgi:hypothetical protein
MPLFEEKVKEVGAGRDAPLTYYPACCKSCTCSLLACLLLHSLWLFSASLHVLCSWNLPQPLLACLQNVIGSWVLVNLVLAVLYLKYTMDRNSQSPSPGMYVGCS